MRTQDGCSTDDMREQPTARQTAGLRFGRWPLGGRHTRAAHSETGSGTHARELATQRTTHASRCWRRQLAGRASWLIEGRHGRDVLRVGAAGGLHASWRALAAGCPPPWRRHPAGPVSVTLFGYLDQPGCAAALADLRGPPRCRPGAVRSDRPGQRTRDRETTTDPPPDPQDGRHAGSVANSLHVAGPILPTLRVSGQRERPGGDCVVLRKPPARPCDVGRIRA